MKRYGHILSFTICAITASAGELFERNGLAIDGYDPVADFTEHKSGKGMSEYQGEFRGSIFQFASAARRDVFVAGPAKYALRYDGCCTYGMAKEYKAKIDPEAFNVIHGTLYLNYSESVRTRWLSDLSGYIQ